MKMHPKSVFRFLFTNSTAAFSRLGAEFGRLQALSLVILFFGWLAMPLHGQYVYVTDANDQSPSVSGYSIGPGGVLIGGLDDPFTLELACSVTVDRTSQFVCIANLADHLIVNLRIGPGGVLGPVTGGVYSDPYFHFSPTCVTASPNRDFIYATSLDETLRAFSLGIDGQLTPSGSPLATGSFPTCVAIAPNGAYAYVTNEDDNTVSGYKIRGNGTLTEMSGSPFSIEAGSPVAAAVTSRFLFVVPVFHPASCHP
jgi:6-phosphogluconolactonase (cycloisomerase 2 family)